MDFNFMETTDLSPAINMAIDKYLIDNKIPTLRTYTWHPPAISIGKNQKLNGINTQFCKDQDIKIIRRPTGGRAVLHQGDISYSVVLPIALLGKEGHSVLDSYIKISNCLVEVIAKLIGQKPLISARDQQYFKDPACFAITTGADLQIDGKKIAGSAQYRTKEWILQHGSLLINQDFSLVTKVFNTDPRRIQAQNLSELTSSKIQFEDFSHYCLIAFSQGLRISNTNSLHINSLPPNTLKSLSDQLTLSL